MAVAFTIKNKKGIFRVEKEKHEIRSLTELDNNATHKCRIYLKNGKKYDSLTPYETVKEQWVQEVKSYIKNF